MSILTDQIISYKPQTPQNTPLSISVFFILLTMCLPREIINTSLLLLISSSDTT